MNKHEIFNKVARHLIKQGGRAMENGVCRYRGPAGTKCAIGALIPDELYDPEIESKSIANVLWQWPKIAEYLVGDVKPRNSDEEEAFRILRELQGVHDGGFNGDFKQGLRYTRENFGIEMEDDVRELLAE